MIEKCSLPVTAPYFSAYHYQGSNDVCAALNPSLYNWHLNHSVQLRCSLRFLKGYTSPELWVAATSLRENPYLERHDLNLQFLLDSGPRVVKNMLDAGYYVHFSGVDDFYVEGKTFAGQKHFAHDGLICGYDNRAKTYEIFAYDKDWIYRTFTTPQKGFWRGARWVARKMNYPVLTAAKATPGPVALAPLAIADEMEVYLLPSVTFSEASGLVVHEYLGVYLDKLREGEISSDRLDRRIFRLLWEHKRCMLDRICAVEKVLGTDTTLSSAYAPLVEEANLMRMLYARYHIGRDTSLLLSIKKHLLHLRDVEKELLPSLVDKIRKEDRLCSGML